MLFSNVLVGSLIATAAYAFPTARERLNARTARRASSALHPEVVTFDASTAPRAKFSSRPKISNATHDEYSSNWGGAVLSEGAGTWTGVTGTFTVPVPSEPSGDTAGWASASAWVGIDGDTCGSAILQTGVDFTIQNGAVSYDAWFEWFPDAASDFSGFVIRAGDTITATVTASSANQGVASIWNQNTGVEVIANIGNAHALCQQDAEWIVEDFEENGGMVPFANFGTVTFNSASATKNGGSTVGPSGATVIDIYQNQQLTSTSIGGSSVTVSYI